MSFHTVSNPHRRKGRPRCEKTHLVALEYIMHLGKRPPGMFKQLVLANDLSHGHLSDTVARIRSRARGEG